MTTIIRWRRVWTSSGGVATRPEINNHQLEIVTWFSHQTRRGGGGEVVAVAICWFEILRMVECGKHWVRRSVFEFMNILHVFFPPLCWGMIVVFSGRSSIRNVFIWIFFENPKRENHLLSCITGEAGIFIEIIDVHAFTENNRKGMERFQWKLQVFVVCWMKWLFKIYYKFKACCYVQW